MFLFMAETTLRRAEDYAFAVSEIGEEPKLLVCIDDRHLDAEYDPWNTPEGVATLEAYKSNSGIYEVSIDRAGPPGLHVAGAALGVGLDYTSALAIDRQGKLPGLPDDTKTPDVLAKIFARRARGLGVLSLLHEGCAAEMNAQVVNQSVAQEGVQLLPTVREIYPGVNEDLFAHAITAAGKLESLIRPYGKATSCMERSGAYPAIQRAPLVDEKHSSGLIVVDTRANMSLHTRKAREAGVPAYYANLASEAKLLTGVAGNVVPVTEEAILTAAAVRLAAIAGLLPHPDGPDAEFDIRRIEPNMATV
jgi:hypothetical protein